MSYDLDALHQKYGINIASVKFGSVAERASVAIIAAVAGASPVVHQIAALASVNAIFQLGQSTTAGTMNYLGIAGNVALVEPVRIVFDPSAVVNLFATGVAGVDCGTGFIRVFYTLQRNPTSGGAAIGNL